MLPSIRKKWSKLYLKERRKRNYLTALKILNQSSVLSAFVVPVPHYSTTVLLAVVVLATGNNTLQKLHQIDQIQKSVHQSLPSHMWPFWIVEKETVGDIPVTPNGKLDASALLEQYRDKLTPAPIGSKSEVIDRIWNIWMQAIPAQLGQHQITKKEKKMQFFLTLGGSSLSALWCVEKLMLDFGTSVFFFHFSLSQFSIRIRVKRK